MNYLEQCRHYKYKTCDHTYYKPERERPSPIIDRIDDIENTLYMTKFKMNFEILKNKIARLNTLVTASNNNTTMYSSTTSKYKNLERNNLQINTSAITSLDFLTESVNQFCITPINAKKKEESLNLSDSYNLSDLAGDIVDFRGGKVEENVDLNLVNNLMNNNYSYKTFFNRSSNMAIPSGSQKNIDSNCIINSESKRESNIKKKLELNRKMSFELTEENSKRINSERIIEHKEIIIVSPKFSKQYFNQDADGEKEKDQQFENLITVTNTNTNITNKISDKIIVPLEIENDPRLDKEIEDYEDFEADIILNEIIHTNRIREEKNQRKNSKEVINSQRNSRNFEKEKKNSLEKYDHEDSFDIEDKISEKSENDQVENWEKNYEEENDNEDNLILTQSNPENDSQFIGKEVESENEENQEMISQLSEYDENQEIPRQEITPVKSSSPTTSPNINSQNKHKDPSKSRVSFSDKIIHITYQEKASVQYLYYKLKNGDLLKLKSRDMNKYMRKLKNTRKPKGILKTSKLEEKQLALQKLNDLISECENSKEKENLNYSRSISITDRRRIESRNKKYIHEIQEAIKQGKPRRSLQHRHPTPRKQNLNHICNRFKSNPNKFFSRQGCKSLLSVIKESNTTIHSFNTMTPNKRSRSVDNSTDNVEKGNQIKDIINNIKVLSSKRDS